MLTAVESTMTTQYLLPAQRAALYEYIAHYPGLTLVPHVTNGQGKVGEGVQVSGYKGATWTVIFDPKTYAPLGMNTGGVSAGWMKGVTETEVQTKRAFVSKRGELP